MRHRTSDTVPGVAAVPTRAATVEGLSEAALRVLIAVCAHRSRASKRCDPSDRRIAIICGLNVDSVVRLRRQLADAGLMAWEKRWKAGGGRRSNQYTFDFAQLTIPALAVGHAREHKPDTKRRSCPGSEPAPGRDSEPDHNRHNRGSITDTEGGHNRPLVSERTEFSKNGASSAERSALSSRGNRSSAPLRDAHLPGVDQDDVLRKRAVAHVAYAGALLGERGALCVPELIHAQRKGRITLSDQPEETIHEALDALGFAGHRRA